MAIPSYRPIDGVNLVPHLRSGGRKALAHRPLIWHFPHYRHAPGPYSIIRRDHWKYIKFYDGENELYHLGDDLGEKRNLVAERPVLVASLESDLMGELARMGARIPRLNPDFQEKP